MRDKNRIPEILKELEKKWLENPDFRLAQLITIAAKPNTPHPTTFYIEDDDLLKGLISISNNEEEEHQEYDIPYFKRYPNISRIPANEVTESLVSEMLNILAKEKKEIVITPLKLMELNGAPTTDDNWLLNNKSRILILENILFELKEKGGLEISEIGYSFKKICLTRCKNA